MRPSKHHYLWRTDLGDLEPTYELPPQVQKQVLTREVFDLAGFHARLSRHHCLELRGKARSTADLDSFDIPYLAIRLAPSDATSSTETPKSMQLL